MRLLPNLISHFYFLRSSTRMSATSSIDPLTPHKSLKIIAANRYCLLLTSTCLLDSYRLKMNTTESTPRDIPAETPVELLKHLARVRSCLLYCCCTCLLFAIVCCCCLLLLLAIVLFLLHLLFSYKLLLAITYLFLPIPIL